MAPDSQQSYTPRNIAESEVPYSVRLSPDAQKLLYHVKPLYKAGDHGTSAIWLADVDRANSARQFTSGLFNDHSAQFHPDGERIIFLSDRHKASGPQQIYSVSLNGGEAFPLFGKDNKKGVSSFRISPDGRYIAFTSTDEPTSVDEEQEKDKDDAHVFGDERTLEHLKLFTFATGTVRTLEQPLKNHVSFFHWAHDSKKILFAVQKQSDMEFYTGEINIFRVSIALEKDSLEAVGTYRGNFRSMVQTEQNQIVDVKTLDPTRLTDSHALFVHSTSAFTRAETLYGISDDASEVLDLQNTGKVAVLVASGLKSRIDVVDIDATKSVTIKPSTIFETEDDAIDDAFDSDSWDIRARPDGTLVLAAIKSSSVRQEPSNVWAGTAGDDGRCALRTQLSSHLQWMKDAPFCRTEPFYWKAKDGIDLDGVLYYPPGKDKNSGPLPTILTMHGGT